MKPFTFFVVKVEWLDAHWTVYYAEFQTKTELGAKRKVLKHIREQGTDKEKKEVTVEKVTVHGGIGEFIG